MRRRDSLILLGGAAFWPHAAKAQQPTAPVIGFLNSRALGENAQFLAAFRRGLNEAGFVEGQNVAIEYRWAEGQYDRIPALAADLVGRKVSVIVANGPAAGAAKAATVTIPIVFAVGFDPVESGLVASLNRPGGNITGVSILDVQLGEKRLELLLKLAPTATVIALLVNPKYPSAETLSKDYQTAVSALGLKPHILHASSDRDFDAVFATLTEIHAGALVIGNDPFFTSRSAQLAALALRHAVPAISNREFAAAGGLMGYGSSIADAYRLAGVYTGRILKGEKPADLPVQQPTALELVINLKTAKALALTIPQSILATADELIE